MLDILVKFKQGLSRTSNKISQGISDIFTKKKLDQESLSKLEELLILSDLGLKTTTEIIDNLSKEKFNKEISEEEIKDYLFSYIENLLKDFQGNLTINNVPEVILICGVNGNGKTTTIGKLSHIYSQQGKKVLLAACDTFRAAAVEQLKIWAERAQADIVIGSLEADSASVAFQAVEKGKKENYDVVMIDTAGRLHNKANLMEELNKINRVIKKVIPESPHKSILVLDATTGQNAINQVIEFSKVVDLNGIIVTKLDGTAKGGIVVALTKVTNAKILAVGLGEKIEDLKEFNAEAFSKNLVGFSNG